MTSMTEYMLLSSESTVHQYIDVLTCMIVVMLCNYSILKYCIHSIDVKINLEDLLTNQPGSTWSSLNRL